jgi:hypothetical protein
MGWEDGKVDGRPAQVKQEGSRIEAIYDFSTGGGHAHLASNDGENADYVRESDGTVVVDNSRSNPYGD